MEDSSLLREIRRLEDLISDDTLNINEIPKLLQILDDNLLSFNIALTAIQSLRRVLYSRAADNGVLVHETSDNDAVQWLQAKLDFFISLLLRCLHGEDERLHVVAIDSLMDLVSVQCDIRSPFPIDLFLRLIRSLTANSSIGKAGRMHFLKAYMAEFDDIQYWTLRALKLALDDVDVTLANVIEYDEDACSDMVYENSTLILIQCEVFVGKEEEALSGRYFSSAKKHGKAAQAKSHSNALNRAWKSLLCSEDLPRSLIKLILSNMKSVIIPCFREPLMLCDFLTDSYHHGGVITILALEGVFILITEHNLDYPDFYNDLYAVLTSSIFHVKYRERFLTLVWKFLRSSHLPSYLVAAFIKKFARLAITAPPSGALFALAIIFNLLRRFPSCRGLLDRKDAESPNGTDPYIDSEKVPKMSNAIDSSLWELVTLKSHYCPEVARLASNLDLSGLPIVDFDLNTYSSFTYETLIAKHKSKRRKVTMAIEAPKSLFPSSLCEYFTMPV